MEPEKYYIETFGCQMNERDSETIAGLLSQMGLKESNDPRDAQVIVLNTCAVREAAERKVWSRLGKIAAMTRKEPVFILSGCMAEIPKNIEKIKARFPYVNIVTGPGHIDKIPELLREAFVRKEKHEAMSEPLVAVSPGRVGVDKREAMQNLREDLPRVKVPGVSAFVNIMYGCDNFCTYCIVPFVRGPQLSREPRYIIDEVEKLVQDGYKEVTLLGQNVNAYGLDLGEDYDFADLLRDLDKTPGILRIRFATSHPRDFTRKMVDVIRDSEHVCEHFHLPLQSGSDRILKLMNRGYTRQQYLELCEYIKQEIPGSSITTDIIVGFPGETDEDFEETLDMVRRCRFDGAFTFIFSPRKGTAAARMEDNIPREEKTRRLERLVEIQKEITREENEKLIGSVVEVLIEGRDERNKNLWAGRTRTNKITVISRGDAKPGDLVKVKVEEVGTWYLKGPLV